MINFKVRLKNPIFILEIILAILTPILAYTGLSTQDITSWSALGGLLLDAVSNPYILVLAAVSVWNAVNDPTTSGITDSARALQYNEPSEDTKGMSDGN